MSNKLELINMALAELGESTISSLNDNTARANAAKNHYEESRRDVLSRLDWPSATKRDQLTKDGTAPAFEYSYAYALPSDFIRLTEVYDISSGSPLDPAHPDGAYQIEVHQGSLSIISDMDPVQIRYIYDLEDVSLMDTNLRKCIWVKLAGKIAKRITGQNNLKDQLDQMFEKTLAEAGLSIGEQRTMEHIPHGNWARARFHEERDLRREQDLD